MLICSIVCAYFKCRFFLKKVNEGLTLPQANLAFEKSGLDRLYCENNLTSIQKKLFDNIFHLASIADIKRTLDVFASINISDSIASSTVYKNIINKLAYLEVITVVFALFITIYTLFVFPVFSNLIDQYPDIGDNSFHLLPSIWILGLTASALPLIFTISFRHFVKNIDSIIVELPSKHHKFFIPKNAMKEITSLNNIITGPLNDNNVNDDLSNKVDAITEAGLNESVELGLLFSHHSEKLEQSIWQYAKRMFAFMYTLVTLSIGFYVIQIYNPIFKLGAFIQ